MLMFLICDLIVICVNRLIGPIPDSIFYSWTLHKSQLNNFASLSVHPLKKAVLAPL